MCPSASSVQPSGSNCSRPSVSSSVVNSGVGATCAQMPAIGQRAVLLDHEGGVPGAGGLADDERLTVSRDHRSVGEEEVLGGDQAAPSGSTRMRWPGRDRRRPSGRSRSSRRRRGCGGRRPQSLRWPPQCWLTSACTATPASSDQRRRRWSRIETTSNEPSGIHPSPDGCPSTTKTSPVRPSGSTVSTRWR
jgi:hypothetical protein